MNPVYAILNFCFLVELFYDSMLYISGLWIYIHTIPLWAYIYMNSVYPEMWKMPKQLPNCPYMKQVKEKVYFGQWPYITKIHPVNTLPQIEPV
jgi:hypothetical protein